MLILWIRKAGASQPARPKSDGESFQKHNEAMKNFRQSHPDLTIIEPGDMVTPDGNILAAINKVKLATNAHN